MWLHSKLLLLQLSVRDFLAACAWTRSYHIIHRFVSECSYNLIREINELHHASNLTLTRAGTLYELITIGSRCFESVAKLVKSWSLSSISKGICSGSQWYFRHRLSTLMIMWPSSCKHTINWITSFTAQVARELGDNVKNMSNCTCVQIVDALRGR